MAIQFIDGSPADIQPQHKGPDMKLVEDWNTLVNLQSRARYIQHLTTCILAIPGYPDNLETIEGLRTSLAKELEETRELLNKAAEETK